MSNTILELKNVQVNKSSTTYSFKIKINEVGIVFNANDVATIIINMIKEISPMTGEIILNDLLLNKKRLLHKKIGYAFRERGHISNLSIYENVNLPVKYSNESKELTEKALNDAMIPSSLWNKRPHTVDWTIRKKMLLARSVVLNPILLFLDNPSALFKTKELIFFKKWLNIQKKKEMAIIIGTDEVHSGLVWGDWFICPDSHEQVTDKSKHFDSNFVKMSELFENSLLSTGNE